MEIPQEKKDAKNIIIILNKKSSKIMVRKKKFLLLAIAVGFIGVALGSYTMFLSINDIIKP